MFSFSFNMDKGTSNKSNHKFKDITCDVCEKTFKAKSYLIVLQRSHSGDKPYKCDICAKKFTFKGNLKQHMLVYSGEKKCQYHVCGKYFGQQIHT